MSNFRCDKCNVVLYDSPLGYITGCEHYRPDVVTPKIGTCGHCQYKDTEVRYTTDPYQADVNAVDVWGWWCDSCYHEQCQEI